MTALVRSLGRMSAVGVLDDPGQSCYDFESLRLLDLSTYRSDSLFADPVQRRQPCPAIFTCLFFNPLLLSVQLAWPLWCRS
jgi:hypothetical protein